MYLAKQKFKIKTLIVQCLHYASNYLYGFNTEDAKKEKDKIRNSCARTLTKPYPTHSNKGALRT